MKKMLSLITLSLIAFLAIFLFMPESVLADGMIIPRLNQYPDRWDYSDENNQQVFINYDNGLQKMIISVGFEGKNSNGVVWLFPVPADPSKVAIDVVKSLPQLNGEEISERAKLVLDDTAKFLPITQIYTIPFTALFTGISNARNSGTKITNSSLGTKGKGVEQDVVVYEHLEEGGLTSEIITAKTASGLYDYLKNKGLKIESGSIPVLDNYIGKEYSFIASWPTATESNNKNKASIIETIAKVILQTDLSDPTIDWSKLEVLSIDDLSKLTNELFLLKNNDSDRLKEITESLKFGEPSLIGPTIEKKDNKVRQIGVSVAFPTKKIYYPLLPTSVYASKVVPATIRIMGFVSPKVFQDIKSYTKTEYYIDSYANFGDDLKNFYNKQDQNVKYTKIEINAPSKFLTNDLWVNKRAPVKTYYSAFVAGHPAISSIIIFILSSIIAGILAGLIIFRDLRRNVIKLGLIGLFNCLSIYGLLIATVLAGTKNKNESIEPLIVKIKQKGYFWKRRVATILFFTAMPFLVFGLFALSSLISELSYSPRRGFDMTPVLIIYVLPISALIIIFVIKKIKNEDRDLFKQLKSSGYSSWSFYPTDKMKIVFVPVFSISFLIISWLLVKLVSFTV